jgi:hypothetical protein
MMPNPAASTAIIGQRGDFNSLSKINASPADSKPMKYPSGDVTVVLNPASVPNAPPRLRIETTTSIVTVIATTTSHAFQLTEGIVMLRHCSLRGEEDGGAGFGGCIKLK